MIFESDSETRAEEVKIDFAVQIEKEMQRVGVTAGELANKLTHTKEEMYYILRGDVNLSIEEMARIAYALGAKLNVQLCR